MSPSASPSASPVTVRTDTVMDAVGSKRVHWNCLPYVWLFCAYPYALVEGYVTAGSTGVANLMVTVTTAPPEQQFETTTGPGGYFGVIVSQGAITWEAVADGNDTYSGSRASGIFEHYVQVPPWGP